MGTQMKPQSNVEEAAEPAAISVPEGKPPTWNNDPTKDVPKSKRVERSAIVLVAMLLPATAATIASMIGGLQVQEALKLLHGLPVSAGDIKADEQLWLRLEVRVASPRDEPRWLDPAGVNIGGLIETLSRSGRDAPDRWLREAGPLRISDLKRP